MRQLSAKWPAGALCDAVVCGYRIGSLAIRGTRGMQMRRFRSLELCAVIGLTLAVANFSGAADDKPGFGPRPVYATTTLVDNGRIDCAIIFPDEAGYGDLAMKIASKILVKTGAGANVLALSSKHVTDRPFHLVDSFRQKHLIVLGHSANNVAHLAMYANLRAMADSNWPGPGNFELRTACDPFWTGYNGIVLGSSDLAGVSAATDEMLARLDKLPDGPTLTLPRWCTVVIDGKEQADAEVRTYMDPADSRPAQLDFVWAMMAYQRTGSGKLLEYLKRWMEWHSENPPNKGHYYRTAWIDPLEICSNFELVDSAALSKIDGMLFTSLIEGRDYSHVLGRRHGNYGNRHQTYGTYGFFRGYRYLLRGVPNEAARKVLEPLEKGTHEYLDSLLDGYREDAEDRESFHSEGIFVRFASGEGRFDWWTRGQGRLAALRALFCQDNLGYFCGSGGGWWSAAELRGSISYQNVVAAAAFFDRDSELASFGYKCGFCWTVQVPDWPMPAGFESRPPLSLLGAQVLPVSRPHWDAPHKHPAVADLSYEQCFEKLAFRDGFERNDQYLILQGLDSGSDANAIISYTDRGHIFLMQNQKAQNYFYRNGVYVSRGLDKKSAPPLAELVAASNTPQVSLTATALRDYHGVNWRRNIIYRRGTYFVVIDVCRAEEDGQYGMACVWRCPNAGRLDGKTWTVRSGLDDFVLRSADESRVRLELIKDRPLGDWHEAAGYTVVQDRSGAKSVGDVTSFQNLFYTTGPGDEQEFQVRSVGDMAVLVKGRRKIKDKPAEGELALIGAGPVTVGGVKIEAEVFYLSRAGIHLTDDGVVTLDGQPVKADIALERVLQGLWDDASIATASDAASDVAVAAAEPIWRNEVAFIRPEPISSVSVTSNKPFTGGTPDDLIDGRHPMYFNLVTKWNADTTLTFDLGAEEELAEIDLRFNLSGVGEKRAADGVTVELSNDNFQQDCRQVEVAVEARDQYELPWSAYDFLLVGGSTIPVNQRARHVRLGLGAARYGAEVIFRRGGTQHARPRWLQVADLDGDGTSEIVATTDLEQICVFSADGKRLWSAMLEGWVSSVLLEDLETDGTLEVIASTFDSNIYAFDATGKQRWRWHRDIGLSEFGGAGLWKRDADGRAQVFGASYIGLVSVDADGKMVAAPDVGGVRMDAVLPVGVDMTGDGVDDQVEHGYFTNNVFVLDGSAMQQAKSIGVPAGPALGLRLIEQKEGVTKVLCVTTGGVTMVHVTEPRIKAGGPVVDASGGEKQASVTAVSPEVEAPWSYAIGPVNAFALIGQEGNATPLIAIGKRDGMLMLLDADGRLTGHTVMAGDIRGLAAVGKGDSARLAVATARGIHILNTALATQTVFDMADCGAVAWLADNGRATVIGMSDHGQLAAFEVK